MELILLGAATSADLFAAALGISASGIRFPFKSVFTAAFSGAAVLWLSSYLASAADRILPIEGAVVISKGILFIMSLYAIFGEKIKKKFFVRRKKGRCPSFNYIEVMNDPKISDCDNSKTISPAEGAVMGTALSADSLFMGISAGIAGLSPVLVFISSLLFGTAAAVLGSAVGSRISLRGGILGSLPVGGIILLILAILL